MGTTASIQTLPATLPLPPKCPSLLLDLDPGSAAHADLDGSIRGNQLPIGHRLAREVSSALDASHTTGGAAEHLANGKGRLTRAGRRRWAVFGYPVVVAICVSTACGSAGPIHRATDSETSTLANPVAGRVIAWGTNYYGELGLGSRDTTIPLIQHSPGPVTGLTHIVSVAAGLNLGVAADGDGTVWTWGSRSLGNGNSYGIQPSPGRVAGLAEIRSVTAVGNFAMALKRDGTVWAWGDNRLPGDGTAEPKFSPTEVRARSGDFLGGVTQIAAGDGFALALTADGTVDAWGNKADHTGLGPEASDAVTASPVGDNGTPLASVRGIAAGADALAVKTDGTVWTWGIRTVDNGLGGTSSQGSNSSGITQVPGLFGVVAISAGRYEDAAVTSDGSVWVWGLAWQAHGSGQPYTLSSAPQRLVGLANVRAITADTNGGQAFAVAQGGTVWTWAVPHTLQGDVPEVKPVPGLTDAREVVEGQSFQVVLT
ncbi:MAG: RCC1 domain-containing protein [Candidatus Dormibacteria bacterium]